MANVCIKVSYDYEGNVVCVEDGDGKQLSPQPKDPDVAWKNVNIQFLSVEPVMLLQHVEDNKCCIWVRDKWYPTQCSPT